MHLDPDIREHMSLISHLTHADLWTMDPQTVECPAKLQAAVAPVEPPQVAIREDMAPGPHGPVPVRIYTPPGGGRGLRPGLVWLHGGGSSPATSTCRRATTRVGLCAQTAPPSSSLSNTGSSPET